MSVRDYFKNKKTLAAERDEAKISLAVAQAIIGLNKTLEKTMRRKIQRLENDAESVQGFLDYLARHVPDYEGYILEHMEEQEQKDADN